MRLEKIRIQKYRSIDDMLIVLPENKPLILFGPNNAGKSNILSAIDRLLGERYPTYIEMLESDFYMRNKTVHPTSTIAARFSDVYYRDRYDNTYNEIAVTYGFGGNATENILHDGSGKKLFISNEDRAACQSFLIDAERNIQSAFNYGSKYSLLSKFSHQIHKALNAEHKEELSEAFNQIKSSFEKTAEFSGFFNKFSDALKGAVKGFVHSLAVDFSAYDPNNYAKSLRIYAKEGDSVRSFEEFGTGEQQVLLMAFVKAYMEIFTSENFVLIIEEPEAHLHPLAQKWLKEYIVDMCSNGIQVVISTHSTDFIDAEYLEGLVRVYKEGGTTKAIQLSKKDLYDFCVASGVPKEKTSPESITDFYATKLFPDQLKGMFAETIILVEGETEFFTIPTFLKRIGFSMAEHGVEIINCRGKKSIPLFWRLFRAYGYNCYFIFDGDAKTDENNLIFNGVIDSTQWEIEADKCVVKSNYAYFGVDFEKHLRAVMTGYSEMEKEVSEQYHISSKPGKAKAIAQHCEEIPQFIIDIKDELEETIEI
ncbi:MAG: ATP-dependent endonuclease [Ruminococcaceae bacterium]|nr:ATP-dependent endonuclease [Oscillospiraceae bacterium]